jgi:glutamate synthase (NADPH) small chain
MPTQAPEVRAHNFKEVALGYDGKLAEDEASRCLHCKNSPCVKGCPVSIDIPGFIAQIRAGDIKAANDVLLKSSSLSAVCGRVCPQESQCEKFCVRGIAKGNEPVAIGRLERYVADYARENNLTTITKPTSNGHKVAIVGAGPSGLTCAGDLAKLGYDVTIFEALHLAGGVLSYGIPEFRLPKDIVKKEIGNLEKMGVTIRTDMVIGKVFSVDELMKDEGFEAVFLGTGAGLPRFMWIPGENLKGVYSANEFLTRINLMKAYKESADTPILHGADVAVIGGGNVAMDAARCAMRLGAKKVYIIYRRSLEELPARHEEVEHAKEEGIEFHLLNNPVAILGNADLMVTGIQVIQMKLGDPDASGRRSPIEIPGSELTLPVDVVIEAIGTSPNPLITQTTDGLSTNPHGCIVTNGDSGATTKDGVFAGGDTVTGAATVILAMGAGKNAAAAIDTYIKNKKK